MRVMPIVALLLTYPTLLITSGCRESTLIGPTMASPETSGVRSDEPTMVKSFAVLSDSALWVQIVRSDSEATVGFRAVGASKGYDRGRVLISAAEWVAARQSVRKHVQQVLHEDSEIPWSVVKIRDLAMLSRIRKLPFVEYIEPARMLDLRYFSDPGCSEDPYSGPYPSGTTSSGDILPAVYQWSKIDRAWAYAPGGRGVTLGLVDTGADEAQPELGSAFASGESGGRTIQRIGGGPGGTQTNLGCSHGTRLAGVMTAPRNGQSILGVAWAANLVSTYHGDDLVASEPAAQLGIRNAVDAGAKVIEMAFGTVTHYSAVINEIQRGYYNFDVVFVGAGGTWAKCFWTNSNEILFPAELPEVIAVSPANSDGSRPCDAGYGPQLDLIAYHRQPTTGMGTSLVPVSVEASSHASALVAGVAGLVRQRYPTLSNVDVVARLVNTAGTRCGMPSAWHLLVNAEAAVGGLCISSGAIGGPDFYTFDRPDSPDLVYVEFSVAVSGGSGPVAITWWNGTTGPTLTYPVWKGDYTASVSVEIRDAGSSNPPVTLVKTIQVQNLCDDPGVDPNAEICRPY